MIGISPLQMNIMLAATTSFWGATTHAENMRVKFHKAAAIPTAIVLMATKDLLDEFMFAHSRKTLEENVHCRYEDSLIQRRWLIREQVAAQHGVALLKLTFLRR